MLAVCARPVGAGMVRSLRTCRVAGVQVSPPANGVTGPRACVPGGPRPAFPEALQELLTARGSHAPPARLPFFIQLVFQFVSEANVRGAALHWPEKEEALPRAHESSGAGFGVSRCMVPVTGMDFSDGSLHPDGPPGPAVLVKSLPGRSLPQWDDSTGPQNILCHFQILLLSPRPWCQKVP